MATGWPMKVTYANGDVYSASDVNDTNGTINLLGQSVAYTAGKNKIINGDFRFNQRNFTSVTTTSTYGFDRFLLLASGGTSTYTPQTFTPGTAPAAPYEAINFARLVTASQAGSSDYSSILQRIEDVRTLANQTVTMSFWAKASTGTPNIGVTLAQNFGGGGSSAVNTSPAVKTITSSWARYSFQVTVPSISGKTVGTNSCLEAFIFTSCGTSISSLGYAAVGLQNVTIDIWGVQVETGSTATAFQTASGSIAGELALCQRYLPAFNYGTANGYWGPAFMYSSTGGVATIPFQVTPRVAPTGITATAGSTFQLDGVANYAVSAIAFSAGSATGGSVNLTTSGATAGHATALLLKSGAQLLFTGCEL